ARNSVEPPVRVRQPLAELKVRPGKVAYRRAVERFGDQLMDELNVKKVTLEEAPPAEAPAPEGWASVVDRDAQVLLDVRVTEELAREGLARDVVRHVQNARKGAGLELADHIELRLTTGSARLQSAIDAFREMIADATQADHWRTESLDGRGHK